jgi:hypothetical protein
LIPAVAPDGQAAVLVSLEIGNAAPEDAAGELARLAESAGARRHVTVGGRRARPDPKFYAGSGKVREIALAAEALNAATVIFNHALSPAQQRNLEKELGRSVLDRTELILTIFAQRALQIALLRRRERVVEDHPAGVERRGGATDLRHLAAAGEILRVRPCAAAAHLGMTSDAGALRQPQQLFGGVLGGRPAEIQAHEYRGLVIGRGRGAQASFSGSAPTLTAREGTTVEMACL